MVRAGLVALAAAVLFFCYWGQSQAVLLPSDGSSNAPQAWAMLHGNLLLHNWRVSDVSFYLAGPRGQRHVYAGPRGQRHMYRVRRRATTASAGRTQAQIMPR